jgi:hypothetical protein
MGRKGEPANSSGHGPCSLPHRYIVKAKVLSCSPEHNPLEC